MLLHSFSRIEMLIGTTALKKLKNSKVAIFGIGGVGSFVAEALARSGVGNIVLIDNDDICVTNINRQIHALHNTIGKSKVETMKERILNINPKATVITYQQLYNSESAEKLLFNDYNYVVDAIDTVTSKLDLIERCKEYNISIISAMGAGNKLEPTMLEVEDIYNTSICPLAKVMRKQLRKRGIKDLKVVYSKEKPIVPLNYENTNDINTDKNEVNATRDKTIGSVSFVPSVAGLIIASEVVRDLII